MNWVLQPGYEHETKCGEGRTLSEFRAPDQVARLLFPLSPAKGSVLAAACAWLHMLPTRMVVVAGVEPATNALSRRCSTAELHYRKGAVDRSERNFEILLWSRNSHGLFLSTLQAPIHVMYNMNTMQFPTPKWWRCRELNPGL